MSRPGLVDRVGGPDGLRRILTRFYDRLALDPMVCHHFAGRDLQTIIDGQHAFLSKALGATTRYTGRHPKDAHRALAPILTGQFDRRLVLLEQELRAAGLDDDDREQWLAVERSMRRLIVHERPCNKYGV